MVNRYRTWDKDIHISDILYPHVLPGQSARLCPSKFEKPTGIDVKDYRTLMPCLCDVLNRCAINSYHSYAGLSKMSSVSTVLLPMLFERFGDSSVSFFPHADLRRRKLETNSSEVHISSHHFSPLLVFVMILE